MCAQGAELLSFVDPQGRVQRQELTLLDEHCVWTSGGGLRTGRVERGGGALSNAAAAVVHADPNVVSARLLRAAHALASYEGEDRYILHMKRVLALAREGIEMAEGNVIVRTPQPPAPQPPVEPPAPGLAPASEPVPYRESEGLVMLAVLGVGLLVSIFLVFWLM
jgi:hypothetical protein